MYEVCGVDEYVFFGAVDVGAQLCVAWMLAQDCVAGGPAPLIQLDTHTPIVLRAVAEAGVVVVDLVGFD